MKKFSLLVLFVFAVSVSYTQDTSIVKYLPLKVGNAWIYNFTGSSGSGSVKLKILSSVVQNNHTYYYLQQTGNPCSCAQQTYSPFLLQLNQPIRIDSSSGNIFWASTNCGWHIGEMLYDSLKMDPGPLIVSNSCFFVNMQDTNNVTVFGIPTKSKYPGMNIMTYYKFRRYAKNFGLVYSTQGCSFSTTCIYSLRGCVIEGVVFGDTSFLVGVSQISSEMPTEYSLSQNYPNPFNPITKLKFQMPKSGLAELKVFDVLGKEVQVLVNQEFSPGTYEVDFDGSDLPSGVYYYRLEVNTLRADEPEHPSQEGSFTQTKKMVLIK
jgi:Secretion system C-terminal sorting domain